MVFGVLACATLLVNPAVACDGKKVQQASNDGASCAKTAAQQASNQGSCSTSAGKAAYAKALEETDGNRTRAAKMLGIGERTLYRKIKEYEIE